MTRTCRVPDHPITQTFVFSVPPCLRGEALVSDLPITCDHPITRSPHSASSTYRVATNGASCVAGCLRPEITLIQTIADSTTITLTSATSNPQTAASRCALKICRCTPATFGLWASLSACASRPIIGLESKTLCQDAANVTATSQHSGASVTHIYRPRPILTMIVVATQSATAASNW